MNKWKRGARDSFIQQTIWTREPPLVEPRTQLEMDPLTKAQHQIKTSFPSTTTTTTHLNKQIRAHRLASTITSVCVVNSNDDDTEIDVSYSYQLFLLLFSTRTYLLPPGPVNKAKIRRNARQQRYEYRFVRKISLRYVLICEEKHNSRAGVEQGRQETRARTLVQQ